jgi:hypothetical protein
MASHLYQARRSEDENQKLKQELKKKNDKNALQAHVEKIDADREVQKFSLSGVTLITLIRIFDMGRFFFHLFILLPYL